MSNKLYEESDVQAIANAIRSKNGSSDTYMVSEMAQAVLDIPTGTTPTGTKQITISSAGTTTENVSAYANAEITVPQGQYKPNIDATPTNPSISVSNGGLITAEVMTQYVNDLLKPSFTEGYVKSSDVSMKVKIGGSATHQLTTVNGQTVTPTTSTQYIAVQGDYVLGAINVDPIPSQYIIPTGTLSISQNGQGINVKNYEYVDVSVSGGVEAPTYWRHLAGSDTGWSVSVENNHVKFIRTALNSGKSVPITGAKNGSNNLNMPKIFTINSGDTVRVLFYNVVNSNGIEWNANAKQADSTTSLSYGIGDSTHTSGVDMTFTATTTKDIGCWFAFFANNVLGTIEFDFKIFVNGEWVC